MNYRRGWSSSVLRWLEFLWSGPWRSATALVLVVSFFYSLPPWVLLGADGWIAIACQLNRCTKRS